MSSRNLVLLAAGVIVLFAAVFFLDRDGGGTTDESSLLLPTLKGAINQVESVNVTGSDGTVTIGNEEGRWVVPEKHGYPADTSKLRSLLLALAEARRIEQKTANPELYGHLGVGEPGDDEDGGVLVEAKGADLEQPVAVILGDPAQGDYRYARLPGEEASWLIDRNPEVPEAPQDWLLQEIVDIPPADVRAAEIRHADGATIRIRKSSADETNYEVLDIPEGRELSYPSVANGIAGVLSNLQLEDVRPADTAGTEPAATVSLAAFDGLAIDIDVWREAAEEPANANEPGESTYENAGEPATWVALRASATEPVAGQDALPADTQEAQETEDMAAAASADADPANPEDAGPLADARADALADAEETADDHPAEAADVPDPRERAAAINDRVSGWQYRLADYKARQLTRRWEDLLQAEDE